MKQGSVVQFDWYSSREGAEILRAFLQSNIYQRKQFGFLEKPNLPPNIDEVSYKLFVHGKAGIGKTSTIARLAGTGPTTGYQDTAGINVTAVYWPVKLIQSAKILLFRLELWDVGEVTLKKFDHMLPSCKEEADSVLFLFSFADRASFEELAHQISQVIQPNDKPCCPIVIGTRYDLHTITDVTTRDIREFEQQWKISVIKLKNVLPESQSKVLQKAEFSEIALALNIICEQLWSRDQSLLGLDLPSL